MSLDPLYVTAPSLQEIFVDKDSGLPLSGGKVFFYRDTNRTEPKAVYELQGNQANYTYSPLPNPVILSSAGSMADNNGNDIIPYYKPYDADGNEDLYYIVVQNANGVPQFTRQAWPNPTGVTNPSVVNTDLNLIPNGQFLAHTDLPSTTNALVGGSNVIAQGGFSIELDDSITSINTLTFIREPAYTAIPPQSPRWLANFVCVTPVGTESSKSFSVKFNDVNKFCEPPSVMTFGFWAVATNSTPISISVFKDFGTGGAPSNSYDDPQRVDTITTEAKFFTFALELKSNEAFTLGLNNDDFLSFDINFPTNLAFDVRLTDFVLLYGDQTATLDSYPIQTNADMLARGVAGWMDVPNPDGSDLYLPLVLTRQGLTFDNSTIGKIEAAPGIVLSPDNPLAEFNDMPCDGASYVSSNYSAIGIPYKRLSDYLMKYSPLVDYPIYGTGTDFATGWRDYSTDGSLFIIVNNAGTPIAKAADGIGALATGFSFAGTLTYSGAQTGASGLFQNFGWGLNANFQAISKALTVTSVSEAGGTAFGLSVFNTQTGLYAEQTWSGITGTAQAASLLAASPCKYFTVVTNIGTYNIIYRINNTGTIPAPAGTSYIIDLPTTASNYQVAQYTSYALRNLQATRISGLPAASSALAGKYFTFQANPASIRNFYVWYQFNDAGVDPKTIEPTIAGYTGIKVSLATGDDNNGIAQKTYRAVNSYQFAAPDLRGMFLRGNDPTQIYDLDQATRLNQGLGIQGSFGTYQQQQFLAHTHLTYVTASGAFNTPTSTVTTRATVNNQIPDTGGNEVRPVNSSVNWIIKY